MTLLADVVAASTLVSETSSRSRKVAILAELLRELDCGEVPICVGFLSGVPRQGRVGVGYSSWSPLAAAGVTVLEEVPRMLGVAVSDTRND